ncbi:MAG: EAL domain-containing protein [Gallionellaceae bacterium]|nr:EAL domain-containing protein [Gallionellaceae bacterium]
MSRDGARPLLLLVDDSPANLHVLAAALKADYRLKTATSGADALDLAGRDDHPELILLDVMMPGMSGIEVLRRLRAEPATGDIPVIFVSADTSEQSQLDGLELGADDYLTKPVVASVLRARVRNLLARRRIERQLRLAAHVFEHSGEAIMVTDRDNHIIEVNPAFTRMTGYTLDEVRGRNPRLLASGRTTVEEYAAMWRGLREQGFWQGEMWDRNKDGAIYPKLLAISVVRSPQGEIDFYIASFADIRQQKAAEERIRYIAHHDALTGLPNRLHLRIAIEQAMVACRRSGGEVAVIFIDLDRFKLINDSLGHSIGDGLLVEVAGRLKDSVRASDLVSRLGGDEFVVMLSARDAGRTAANVAKKILERLSQPYRVEGHLLHSTPSLGISLYPQDGDSVEALMKCADTAMYHAKEAGRRQFHFYAESMNRRTRAQLDLENSLHQALAHGELHLQYQPQADITGGRLVGAEALVRWQHPVRGLVPPAEFIPLAEESGLILIIDHWVLTEASRQIAAWRASGLPDVTVAVNLSPRQFIREGLVDTIDGIVAAAGIAPAALEFEITENTMMERAEQAAAVLKALSARGFGIAVDDFGTGYSSLSYLKRLPVSKLKIDRSFVTDIPTDANDVAIATAIIQMAASLGLKVVAEGVETEAQRAFLQAHGCDMMQGYLYSQPLDPDAFAEFVRARAGAAQK